MGQIEELATQLHAVAEQARGTSDTAADLAQELRRCGSEVEDIGGRESKRILAALDSAAASLGRAQTELGDVTRVSRQYAASISGGGSAGGHASAGGGLAPVAHVSDAVSTALIGAGLAHVAVSVAAGHGLGPDGARSIVDATLLVGHYAQTFPSVITKVRSETTKLL